VVCSSAGFLTAVVSVGCSVQFSSLALLVWLFHVEGGVVWLGCASLVRRWVLVAAVEWCVCLRRECVICLLVVCEAVFGAFCWFLLLGVDAGVCSWSVTCIHLLHYFCVFAP
jgi:hypothetical protein